MTKAVVNKEKLKTKILNFYCYFLIIKNQLRKKIIYLTIYIAIKTKANPFPIITLGKAENPKLENNKLSKENHCDPKRAIIIHLPKQLSQHFFHLVITSNVKKCTKISKYFKEKIHCLLFANLLWQLKTEWKNKLCLLSQKQSKKIEVGLLKCEHRF